MKYKPKQYAEALAGCILEKEADGKKISANFLALLQKNGDIKHISQIIAGAEALLLKKTGNKKIILETARQTDTKSAMAALAKNGDIVEEKINPILVAGLKVIVNGERQLDMSLAHKLNNIFK